MATTAAIAARLGIVHGPIEIDAVVVDVFESMGVTADALRAALVSGRSKFARPKDPIYVAGGSGAELYGRMEGQTFVLDRLIVGQVTYFGADEDGLSHGLQRHAGRPTHPDERRALRGS
jgi:hypothetical protein